MVVCVFIFYLATILATIYIQYIQKFFTSSFWDNEIDDHSTWHSVQQPLKKLPENIVHFLSLIAFIFTLMRYFLLARTSRITLTHSFITLFFGPPSQHSSQTIKGNKDRNSDRLQLFSLIAIELLSILLNAINFCKYLYNFKYSKY